MLFNLTRRDTRQPKLLVVGQGLYLMSLDNLGRTSEAKDHKNQSKGWNLGLLAGIWTSGLRLGPQG